MTRAEVRAALLDEPWLEWYIDEDDEDLGAARVRFAVAQKIALRELRAQNEMIELRAEVRGMLTTCYVSEKESEP